MTATVNVRGDTHILGYDYKEFESDPTLFAERPIQGFNLGEKSDFSNRRRQGSTLNECTHGRFTALFMPLPSLPRLAPICFVHTFLIQNAPSFMIPLLS